MQARRLERRQQQMQTREAALSSSSNAAQSAASTIPTAYAACPAPNILLSLPPNEDAPPFSVPPAARLGGLGAEPIAPGTHVRFYRYP